VTNYHPSPRSIAALLLCITTLLLHPAASAQNRDQRGPIVIYSAEGEYSDAKEALLNSITEQGIVVANELHPSLMLNRTAPDLGIKENVYLEAVTYEFCSSLLSHEMVAHDPANMMACPYAIGLYELTRQPGVVHMAYRKPQGVPGSEHLTDKVEKLVEDIISGALDFL